MLPRLAAWLLVSGFCLFVVARLSVACNEAVCASIVSKCMLTQSCECDTVNYTCSRECFYCLSYLYDECCSCIDLCPKFDVKKNPLGKKSHVEDFDEPIPSLFQALTIGPDPDERWVPHTYAVDINLITNDRKHDRKHKSELRDSVNTMTVNCTVAYMSHCTSWNKCKASCQSMGASSYRWFHDGCCECIGRTCINYGINESRCLHCPVNKDDIDQLVDEYDDYGQDDDDFVRQKFY